MANQFYELVNRMFRQYKTPFLVIVIVAIFILVATFAYMRLYHGTTQDNMTKYDDVANANLRKKPIQVYFFYVDWCPHCKTAKPQWTAFKEEYDGQTLNQSKIQCIEINCTNKEDSDPLMAEFNIKEYPTVFLMRDDYRVDFDAKITKSALEQFVVLSTK